MKEYGQVQIWGKKLLETTPNESIPTSPQTVTSFAGGSSSSSRVGVERRKSQLTDQTNSTGRSHAHTILHARSFRDVRGRQALVLKKPPTLVVFLGLKEEPRLKFLCIESSYCLLGFNPGSLIADSELRHQDQSKTMRMSQRQEPMSHCGN
jgi:hypothetical protein